MKYMSAVMLSILFFAYSNSAFSKKVSVVEGECVKAEFSGEDKLKECKGSYSWEKVDGKHKSIKFYFTDLDMLYIVRNNIAKKSDDNNVEMYPVVKVGVVAEGNVYYYDATGLCALTRLAQKVVMNCVSKNQKGEPLLDIKVDSTRH